MVHFNESPLVVIILVNWNSYRDTLECVDSIKESSYQNHIIVVVDNGSVDESVTRLKGRGHEYHLILSDKNTGFTGGNNIGMEYAMSVGANFVFLLNNDTFIEKFALEKMVDAARNDISAGVITPKILFHPDRHLLWAAGTSFDQGSLIGRNAGYKSADGAQYNLGKYLDYATGCALLIRRDVIQAVGLLDDGYFATWEDADYGLRVNNCGYKVLYEPSAIVWHKESASAGGHDNPQYVYYQTRSGFVFQHKWSKSFFHSIRSHSYFTAFCLKRILKFLIQGNPRGVVAIFIAIADALRGRLGHREYKILKITRRKIDAVGG